MNVMRYNEYHQIIQAGIDPEDLFSVAFADIGLNVADNGLYTTREFYTKHPKQCRFCLCHNSGLVLCSEQSGRNCLHCLGNYASILSSSQ